MSQENPQTLDLETHAFRVESPCGRVYIVPMVAVRDDYVDYLIKEDGITREQAIERATLLDVNSWFMEQFSWGDVEARGQCIKQATAEQIRSALDRVQRDEQPGNVARFEERDELVAARDAKRLDQCVTRASVPGGSVPRM